MTIPTAMPIYKIMSTIQYKNNNKPRLGNGSILVYESMPKQL